MRIKISADSTCDLSPELIETYNIGITPLYIEKGGQNCRDGIDITPQEIFDCSFWMPQSVRKRARTPKRLPRSCAKRRKK